MPIEIKDRHSGRVLFETGAETLKDALEEAVMSGVSLSCADLRNADLREAFLVGANLSGADFSGASLFKAMLWKSNLVGARFCNVDLRSANIRYANLEKAVLRNSELIGVNFLQPNLTQADFRSPNLEGVELRGANRTGVLFDVRPKAPERGSFIGWKKVCDKQGNLLIARLLIPEDAKRTTPLVGRVCRAEFVKVLELGPGVSFAKCKFWPERIFRVGEIVHACCYDDDVEVRDIYGINFYLTREETEPGGLAPRFSADSRILEERKYIGVGWIE